ncbi:MAG: hypothetical protein AB7E09_07245 [Candidatus Izemoplasmatales bacterium]
MSLAPNTQNYMLGRGKIYFDRFDATGARTGLLDLGNAPAFSINIETEKLDHYSSRSGLRVKDKSVILETNITVNFTLDEINVENLKLAFLGDTQGYTQTSGSASSESVTAIHDRYVELEHRRVSNVVVKDSGEVTTYVEGTDYLVDASAGMILALSSGSITDGEGLSVSYDYASIDGQEIQAVTNPTVNGFLKFVGEPAAGLAYEGRFWSVDLTANGEVGFITESDWAQINYTAEIAKDEINHPDSPYFSLFKI